MPPVGLWTFDNYPDNIFANAKIHMIYLLNVQHSPHKSFQHLSPSHWYLQLTNLPLYIDT